MLSKDKTEEMKEFFDECITKDLINSEDLAINYMKIAKDYIEELEKENYNLKVISKAEIEQREQLESKEQKLIKKLEKDIVNITKTMQDGKHCDDYSRCRLKAYRTKTKEILKILKGENNA